MNRGTMVLTGTLLLALASQAVWAGPPPAAAGASKTGTATAKAKKRVTRKAPVAKPGSAKKGGGSKAVAGPAAAARTSLIVDARGTRLLRGMGPRIFSQSGRLVYGDFQSNWEYAQEYGVVVYCNEMSEALKLPQAGSNPLVVGLAGIAPGSETDCVLDDATVESIDKAVAVWDFLAYQRVILVVDN